jgi:origin recognition complex subunit 1
LAPSVILSHCSVSSRESHIAKPVKKARGGARYVEEEDGDEKFYCRHAINAKRGLYYRLDWDKHHASVAPAALMVPSSSSSELDTWGQGTEWDVDTTEEVKPSRPKDGPPPKKRVKRERKEGEEPPSESEDSGSEAEIDSEEDEEDEGLEAIEEEDEEGGEEPMDDEIGNPQTPSRRKRKRGQAAPKTPRKPKKTLAQPTPHSKAAIRKRKRRDDAKSRKKGGFVIRPPTLSFKTDLSHLPKDPWLRAMHVLHVGNRPEALPCRGAEYDKVMQCVGDLLEEGSGGCVCTFVSCSCAFYTSDSVIFRYLWSSGDWEDGYSAYGGQGTETTG